MYTLNNLIDKLYQELDNHVGTNKKITLEKPIVNSMNKKTYFHNFRPITQKLKRTEEDVRSYFEKELNTEVNINQAGGLVIAGIFKPQNIMTIISNYIKEFCTCSECKSCDTLLIKEGRLRFIKCNRCLSKKTF